MVRRLSDEDRRAIRRDAVRFLKEVGFREPPLIPEVALSARQLSLFPGDLEEVLANHDLDPETANRVDALLQVPERLIALRRSLTPPQQKWGCIHEAAHDYLPWHKDVLYFCPILRLPPEVRSKLEAEADAFTAEAFFFGNRFAKEARDFDFGLAGPKELAEKRYLASYYAAFRRYVEENGSPCCLLIWQPKYGGKEFGDPESLVLKYYVKSPTYRGHTPPGQEASTSGGIWQAFGNVGQITAHELVFGTDGKSKRTLRAESFSNSYTVFTLVWEDRDR